MTAASRLLLADTNVLGIGSMRQIIHDKANA
jgi:hypothetical protein